MGMKGRSLSFDSPEVEVGEIDTRAPFASVKAAVSLFGEVAFSGRKGRPSTPSKTSTSVSSPTLEQKAFVTETQLHLAQKELYKYREQLQNAETTRVEALAELDKAKKMVHELTARLTVTNESKELALKAAEVAKSQTNQLKEVSSDTNQAGKVELEQSREQYAAAILELDAAKHELRRIRKEFEASVEAKISAFNQESEAKQQSEANALKADQLSKEIAVVQESLVHVKLATDQAQQEESKIRSEKDSTRESYRLALEETEKKLAALQHDFNPELHKELEAKLAETDTDINAVHKQLEDARASDLESVNIVTSELDGAKEVLQKVAGEESSLRSLVESLKLELETVTKQHNELKEKDAETETLVADLHIKLQNCKAELEAAVAAESKASLSAGDLILALQQLESESGVALQEAEAMKKEAEVMRIEAESARNALSETDKRLEVALKEAEAAKAAEALALDAIKNLSAAKASAARSSTSTESGAAVLTISKEEYESLSQKVQGSEKLADKKVLAAAAQVEAVKASATEAAKRLEVTRKEIEEMEAAREDILKRAEMAEAAKKAVEGELRRWREEEQKRATEMAARLLAETEEGAVSMDSSPPRVSKTSPVPAAETSEGSRKGNKAAPPKKLSFLLPNLSGIFQRKKSTVDVASPSHLPGEKEKHM